jgi:MFS family permease
MKNLVTRLFGGRHFWRHASLDELGELYVSMMFRNLALGLIGIFIPVYLYTAGYSLREIFIFYAYFFATRVVMDIFSAFVVGRFGPKHTMVASYALQIAAAMLFVTLKEYNWPLYFPAILWGASTSMFFISFHVDFSKVKHSNQSGTELGLITIAERIGGALGPLLGGLLAYIFSPEYIFIVGSVILLIGLIPLFMTSEPTKTHQKIMFRDIGIKKMGRELVASVGVLAENNARVVLWPLYLAVFVLVDRTYLDIGTIASLGVIVSMLMAYNVGKLVDQKKGAALLSFGAISNFVLNLFRPFVSTFSSALFITTVGEASTVSLRIPFHQGLYDSADRHQGHRIAFLSLVEFFSSVTKLFMWIFMSIIVTIVDPRTTFIIGFGIAACLALLALFQRFPALDRN